MKSIIRAHKLCKDYGRTKGIADLDLEIFEGEIFGFLGPNGAGKSTTIRLLLGLLKPTSGSFSIFDSDNPGTMHRAFRRIGNVPGEIHLYENLTGHYFLKFFAGLGQSPVPLQAELLDAFGLPPSDLSRKIKYYSRGMKQKLLIIQAMQHDPELLIMDEPSEGLDPLTREVLYRYLFEFKSRGKTVFFSSHNLPEVEKICDRVALVRDAKLVACEKISALKEKAIRHLTVTFGKTITDIDSFNSENITLIESADRQAVFRVKGEIDPLLKYLARFPVQDIIYPQATLEEIFMSYYESKS